MGCGDCTKTIESLRQRVLDLEAAFDEMKEAYLELAKDYDELAAREAPEQEGDE